MASAAKTAPMTTLLMLFYNQAIGLPALTVSAVLMISLVLDALWDPIIGQLSDHCRSRLGRRLPFMYASILPTSVLFVMMWTPPIYASDWAIAAYLGACLIALRFFDTLFELPHAALVPEMTSDYDFRTRLFAIRYLFEGIGGVTVTALAYNVFMKENPDGSGGVLSPEGYSGFAMFTGFVIFLSLTLCTVGLTRILPRNRYEGPKARSWRMHLREVREVLNSRPLIILSGAAIFLSIGSGISSSLNLYWLIYFYEFSQQQITLISIPIMFGMVLTLAAPWLANRLGKRNASLLLIWVYLLVTMVPLIARLLNLISAQSELLLLAVAFQSVMGVASMTMVLITFASMVSDLVEETELRTSRRSEGLLLAANSFVRKATQGLGTLGAGLLLTLVAFPSDASRTSVPADILDELGWAYIGTTLVLFAIITFTLRVYPLDRAAHEANLATLASRAASEG
jgi:Na+/melibiose symporter-like transporter